MRIAVFTSNHPRHLSLIECLAGIADEVFAVQETKTLFPGKNKGMFRQSEIIGNYFTRVTGAEKELFGAPHFLPGNVRQLAFTRDDLSSLDGSVLGSALDADFIVVFGASYIKGELCAKLVQRGALNIHMGVSPYYRGNSCNFWPLYDGRPDMVGATIHLLSAGLDSGAILYHALPKAQSIDPFILGMTAVRVAHQSLAEKIASGELADPEPIPQDKSKEVRYTRAADFNDEVATEYLNRMAGGGEIRRAIENRDLDQFVKPYVG